MSIKDRAEKKIQIVIDKLIDLMDITDSSIRYKIDSTLEKVREIESDILNGTVKNGEVSNT